MTFEESLLNGIPHAEAAEFFLRIRGRDKLAVDAAALNAAIMEMPEDERAAFMKSAMGAGMSPQTPPAPSAQAQGQLMQPAAPMQLLPPAMGQHNVSPQAKVAAAFKLALEQTGVGEPKPTNRAQVPEAEAAQQPEAPAAPVAMPGQPVEPAIPPAVQAYLEAQRVGDQEAEMNHAEFLRAKLEEARAAQQSAEEQASALQEQQSAHEQQQAQVQQQVQDSISQAAQAQDQVLQEQQAAAAMRMAYQQLRGQVLQLASTDPPSLSSDAAALSAASNAAAPQSGPGAGTPQTGPAGQAPSPGTPNTPAPMGDETVSDQIAPNEPTFGNAQPTTAVGQKEPQGDAKTPQKEVLSHYRPLVSTRRRP